MRPKLRKSIIDTEQIINYDNWFRVVSPFFKKLFSLYLVVQRFCPEIENVKKGYARFLTPTGLPQNSEYEKYKTEISLKVSDIDSKITSSTTDLETIYGNDGVNFVCGKYFIGSLKLYLNQFVKKGVSDDDIKAALISGFDISCIEYIKNNLFEYLLA